MSLNSVERCIEYSVVEQEPPAIIEGHRPPQEVFWSQYFPPFFYMVYLFLILTVAPSRRSCRKQRQRSLRSGSAPCPEKPDVLDSSG